MKKWFLVFSAICFALFSAELPSDELTDMLEQDNAVLTGVFFDRTLDYEEFKAGM